MPTINDPGWGVRIETFDTQSAYWDNFDYGSGWKFYSTDYATVSSSKPGGPRIDSDEFQKALVQIAFKNHLYTPDFWKMGFRGELSYAPVYHGPEGSRTERLLQAIFNDKDPRCVAAKEQVKQWLLDKHVITQESIDEHSGGPLTYERIEELERTRGADRGLTYEQIEANYTPPNKGKTYEQIEEESKGAPKQDDEWGHQTTYEELDGDQPPITTQKTKTPIIPGGGPRNGREGGFSAAEIAALGTQAEAINK